MRKFVFLLLMMLPMISFAQRVDKPGEPYEVYCMLHTSKNFPTVEIEGEEYYIAKEKKYDIEFSNEVEIITYMGRRGWKMVDNLTKPILTLCIMKKEVIDDNEVKAGLDLIPVKKEKKKSKD